jgi:leucyl aminopeptidase
MAVAFEHVRTVPDEAEVLAIPVYSDHLAEVGPDVDWAFLAHQGFEGGVGQTQVMPNGTGYPLMTVGLGPSDAVDLHVIRRAAAAVAKAASRQRVVATTLLEAAPEGADTGAVAQAIAEGFALASYRFTRYKGDPKPSCIERVLVVGGGGKKVQTGLERGALIADAVCLARDLVNEPGGTLTPRALAQAAVELAERENLRISVLDEVDIEAAGLGGLLGVNRGSTEPPRFIELSYEPEKPKGTVALVGKGITFDSGGLSLKTADGMTTMKDDMGGAAAVIGAMSVVRHIAPRMRVIAYVPATDNMPGGDATRPGDVLKMRNGKTVEVLNTDAEGRLILADALSLACEERPDAVIDLATLTGACVVALGSKIAGLMGNHQGWIDQVREAADVAGERVWPLPLPTDYRKGLDSDVADLKNVTGGRDGGTLVAGLFLQEFVAEGIPWAHLDIAGPAFLGDDDGEISKGATGFGVRTILQTLAGFRKPKKAEA